VKTKKIFFACFLVGFILLVETCFIGCLTWNQIHQKRSLSIVFHQFFLTRIFVVPFLPKTTTSIEGLQFIGDLTPDNGQWRLFMPPDPLLGFSVGKQIEASFTGRYTYITNEQGFFSTGENHFFYEKTKPHNVYRIMVLGGSTVMGQGAVTPKDNLPANIKSLLPSTSGRNIEVINAGRGGYTSGQELLYLMSEVVYFSPDLVIVYDGWNDALYNNELLKKYGDRLIPLRSTTHYAMEERLIDSYTVAGSLHHVIQNVLDRTVAFLRQWATFETLIKTKEWLANKYRISQKASAPEYFPRSVDLYQENLERMICLARFHKFKIALFLQPILSAGGKSLTEEEKRYDRIEVSEHPFYLDAKIMFQHLREKYVRDNNILINDVSECFSDTPDTVYVDSGHLNAKGNTIVANAIVQRLREKNML
jgi:lysophospholipase L1-like esterase